MELLEQILAKENLNQAYEKVKANKGVAGVDGITVYEVDEYIKENKEGLNYKLYSLKEKKDYSKAIIHYISGMTDKYAIEIYNEIISF